MFSCLIDTTCGSAVGEIHPIPIDCNVFFQVFFYNIDIDFQISATARQ
jgi:hypothetical protein